MRLDASNEGEERFTRITVDQLATRLASKQEKLWLYDVGEKARFDRAHIPGARWVDPLELTESELPPDRSELLVFYEEGEKPRQAVQAANTALALGYRKVSVLSAGVDGWKRAGRQVVASGSPR